MTLNVLLPRNVLAEQLKIQSPIIQAPIGSGSCPTLAAAVSNAGGLGMLAESWQEPDTMRQRIRKTQSLTNQPFGVNLCLAWPQEERLIIALEEGVSIISLFWGNPAPYIPLIHQSEALLMHTVGSAEEARRSVDSGTDIIVAQGWEAGGHVWGQTTTMSLIPTVVDQVSPIPVVAAGGIADGRGIAAAFMLGASGVWLGTRFLASQESALHTLYKEKVLNAQAEDTIYSMTFDIGWPNAPHRTLKNTTISSWEAAGYTSPKPHAGEIIAYDAIGQPIERYSDTIPLPGMRGDLEGLALYMGQSAGLINQTLPVAEIMEQLSHETVHALQQASLFLQGEAL